jgi:hypothetical protein
VLVVPNVLHIPKHCHDGCLFCERCLCSGMPVTPCRSSRLLSLRPLTRRPIWRAYAHALGIKVVWGWAVCGGAIVGLRLPWASRPRPAPGTQPRRQTKLMVAPAAEALKRWMTGPPAGWPTISPVSCVTGPPGTFIWHQSGTAASAVSASPDIYLERVRGQATGFDDLDSKRERRSLTAT